MMMVMTDGPLGRIVAIIGGCRFMVVIVDGEGRQTHGGMDVRHARFMLEAVGHIPNHRAGGDARRDDTQHDDRTTEERKNLTHNRSIYRWVMLASDKRIAMTGHSTLRHHRRALSSARPPWA
jgi:hypothetical protein